MMNEMSNFNFNSKKRRAPVVVVLLLLYMTLLVMLLGGTSTTEGAMCPKCGTLEVPYPLSTGPNCGHPAYGVTCTNVDAGGESSTAQLVFPALSGNYTVLSVDGASRTLILDSLGVIPGTCVSPEMVSPGQGFNISAAPSPFHFTSATKVLLLNCSDNLLKSPLNCSGISPCQRYLDEVAAAAVGAGAGAPWGFAKWKECAAAGAVLPAAAGSGDRRLCCSFTAGGRPDARSISLTSQACSAFVGVVNMDESVASGSWNFGVQLQWVEAPLPPCAPEMEEEQCGPLLAECVEGGKGGGGFVCECIPGYAWDSGAGICQPAEGKDKPALVAGLSTAFAAVMAAAIALAVVYRKRQHRKLAESLRIRELSNMLAQGNCGRSARVFSGREMKRATHGFARDRVLGSGGFGEVYLGKLDDGTTVAVKTAKIGNAKSTAQVVNEVRILSQVNHRNLVRLLGCCLELAPQPLLVYEYVPNGTLADHLLQPYGDGSSATGNGATSGSSMISTSPDRHQQQQSTTTTGTTTTRPRTCFLEWRTRLQIALETAQALAYLHSSVCPPIYHRDVKSTNILLDHSMHAKVSDFGLSRLASLDATHVSTCAQGTIGYLDPEYYRNYQLTDKSDVYSFGVVLLELVSSQRAVDFRRPEDDVNLATLAAARAQAGRLMDVADPALLAGAAAGASSWPARAHTVLATAVLALGCLQPSRVDRPAMKEVADQLQLIIEMEESGAGELNLRQLHLNQLKKPAVAASEFADSEADELQDARQTSASTPASSCCTYVYDAALSADDDESDQDLDHPDPDHSAGFG